MLKLAILCVVLAQVFANTDHKQRLVSDLMKNYMREIEPNATPLKMSVSYVCANLNTDSHELTSKLLEKYTWQDNRLMWTPSHYGGIDLVIFPAKMIWTPDFKLYTAHKDAEMRDDVNAIIFSNGTVLWIPMVVYKTYCDPTSKDESTTCKLSIGSWTYDANTLMLKVDGEGFDTFMYIDNCPYTISEPKATVFTTTYPCCPEPYSSMKIEFKITPRQ